MGITLIVGKPKKGKTLLMRAMMLFCNYDSVYCNIDIKGMKYKHVTTANDILNLSPDASTKGLFLDEINRLMGDSWNYNDLAELMANIATQHRKFRADIFGTIQHLNMTINRLRENCDKIYSPLNIYYNNEGKPILMKVANIEFDYYDRPRFINPFYFPLYKEVKGGIDFACDLYDTFEFVKEFENTDIGLLVDLVEKYKDFDVVRVRKDGRLVSDGDKLGDLRSVLETDERIKPQLAGRIAKRVAYDQKVRASGN